MALLLLGALLAGGLVYQAAGESVDARRYPAPGQRIELANGTKLHVHRQGQAGPVVVFEAGIAGSSLTWATVQPLVAEFACAVSYDRAGLGWSSAIGSPRTVANMVAELAGALEAAELAAPYVLVGHSFGGLLVQAFAHAQPAKIAALVMIDPVTQRGWVKASDAQLRRLSLGARLARRGAWLARFGVVRTALALLVSDGAHSRLPQMVARASAGQGNSVIEKLVSEVRKLPKEVQPMVAAHWSRTRSFSALAAYLECLPESARQAINMPTPSQVPLTILSAATATGEELTERAAWVASNTNGRHMQVENTGHWLQLERPEVVAAAIQDAAFRIG
jgi:pimeloyl-ACP methyl ester carboxylesterase